MLPWWCGERLRSLQKFWAGPSGGFRIVGFSGERPSRVLHAGQGTGDAGCLFPAAVGHARRSRKDFRSAGGSHWSNPYLVIRPATVGLLSGVDANEEQILKPEEVLKALAQLPSTAWPYGRAVAVLVDAKPTTSEQDKIALRRNRGLVAGELQSAHVAIHWIPSS